MRLSGSFTRRIAGAFGEAGSRWLARLPDLLAELAAGWDLALQPPFPDLTYNYVAPVRWGDGTEAVLKVGVPNPELRTEAEALRRFDGRGAVRLLAADLERGALLLERLRPGTTLLALEDDRRATEHAAQVMAAWRGVRAPEGVFPTVRGWFRRGFRRLRDRHAGGSGPFPEELLAYAEGRSRELLDSMTGVQLLHGDLHHWNVLAARRAPWLAIDPKGVIGEPEYEVGAFLRNPIPDVLAYPDLRGALARRLDQFADLLGYERERMVAWGATQAVLAACWSLEEGHRNWVEWVRVAEAIRALS